MQCPICKKPVEDPAPDETTKNYPFCSDRCKLVDLGRWLSDAYQIPVTDPDEQPLDRPSRGDPDENAERT